MRGIDLFSLEAMSSALVGVGEAECRPGFQFSSVRMVQGRRADVDLLIADNFVRSCMIHRPRKVTYFSCLEKSSGTSEVSELFSLLPMPHRVELSDELSNRRRAGGSFGVDKLVCSVHRLPSCEGVEVGEIASRYFEWLQKSVWGVSVDRSRDGKIYMGLKGFRWPLLILKRGSFVDDGEFEGKFRERFHISGGLLSGGSTGGWLEFRKTLNGKSNLVFIHGFRPSLVWPLYRYSQALAHDLVMKAFSQKLMRPESTSECHRLRS